MTMSPELEAILESQAREEQAEQAALEEQVARHRMGFTTHKSALRASTFFARPGLFQ